MAVALVKDKLPVSTLPANIMPGSFTGVYVGQRTQLALLEQAAVTFSQEMESVKDKKGIKGNLDLIRSAPYSSLPLMSGLIEKVGIHGVRWSGLQPLLGYYKKTGSAFSY